MATRMSQARRATAATPANHSATNHAMRLSRESEGTGSPQ
jgi:hypothetical protein